MATLQTIPKDSEDPKKRIYLFYYDGTVQYTRKKVLKWRNNRDGWKMANQYLKEFNTKNVDERFVEEHKLEDKNGKLFTQAWDKFIEVSNYDGGTVGMYTKTCKLWLEVHENKFVKDYTTLDYMAFKSYLEKKMGYSKNSQSIYTRSLKRFFNWCIEVGFLETNIAKHAVGQELKPIKIVPENDLKLILAEIKKVGNLSGYHICLFLYLSGFRISTVLALRWNDIIWNEGVIELPNVKSKRCDIYPLTKQVENLLRSMGAKKTGKIFPEYSDHRAVSKLFNRAQQRLIRDKKINENAHYTIHQLRKSFATRMINSGLLTAYDVSLVAQHKNEQTTKRHYIKVEMERLKTLMDKADESMNFFQGEIDTEFTLRNELFPVLYTSLGAFVFTAN